VLNVRFQLGQHHRMSEAGTDDPLFTDDRDFGRATVFHYLEKRHDGCSREIDVTQRFAGLIQHGPEWHIDKLQKWKP
jgi:hypothetical protein